MIDSFDSSDHEDASVFETAADLFAVLAIAAIVAVVFFGSSIRTLGSSQDMLVEPRTAIGASAVSDVLLLIVTSTPEPSRVELRFNTAPIEIIEIDLSGEERAVVVSGIVNAVSRNIDTNLPRDMFCLIDESASDRLDGFYVSLLAALNLEGYDCGVGFLE